MVKSPGELKWPLADPGKAGLYDGLLYICTRRFCFGEIILLKFPHYRLQNIRLHVPIIFEVRIVEVLLDDLIGWPVVEVFVPLVVAN